jgi:hypothetical protein
MEILEFLGMISPFVEPCINVVTADRDAAFFGGTLSAYCGVVGERGNEAVKKGVYLYADAFGDDDGLINRATAVYPSEFGTKILYFAF